jgi:transposase
LQLKLLLEQIKFIEAQVSDVEAEIRQLLDKINSPITTIPGIGPINGAAIFGEIGDISRFSIPAKPVAYAGIAPSVSQSGIYQSANNKMSKRGSPYLRKALF